MNTFAQKAKWIGLGLAGVIGLLVMLVAGVLVYSNSTLGQQQIRTLAVKALHDVGIEASIGAISGPLPWTVRVRDVSLADAKGIWLEIAEAVLDIRLLDILQGKVTVQEIAVVSPVLSRLPELPPATSPDVPSDATAFMPRLPVAIIVHSARIEQARLDAAVAGIPIEATLKATAQLVDAVLQGTLAVSGTVAGVPLASDITLNADQLDTASPVFQAESSVSVAEKVLSLTVKAEVAPSEKDITASIMLDVPQIASLLKAITEKPEWKASLAAIPASLLTTSGALRVEATVKPVTASVPSETSETPAKAHTLAGGIRMHLSKMHWDMVELQDLLGNETEVLLDGQMRFAENEGLPALTLTKAQLTTKGALGASGTFGFKPTAGSQNADVQAEAQVTLGLAALHKELSGDVQLKAHTRGTVAVGDLSGSGDTASVQKLFSGLTSEVMLTSSRMGYGTGAQSVALETVLVRLAGKTNPAIKDSLQGAFETTIGKLTGGGVSLGSKAEPGFRLSTQFDVSPHAFSVHETRCDAAGLELQATMKGILPTASEGGTSSTNPLADLPRLTGTIDLAVRHWKTLSALTGLSVQGEPARIRLDMRAEKTQHAAIEWTLGALQAGAVSVRGSTGNGQLRGFAPVSTSGLVPFNPIIDLTATVAAGKVAEFIWTGAKLTASGPLETLKLDANLQGKTSATVRLQLDLARKALSLTELEASLLPSMIGGRSEEIQQSRKNRKRAEERFGFQLQRPVNVGFADGIRIDDLALTLLPAGALTATGTMSSSKLAFQAELQNLPVRLARLFSDAPIPDGLLNASVEVKGSPARPTGNLLLVASDVVFPQDNVPPIAIRIEGRLGSTLALSGTVTGLSGTPAVAEVTLPIRFAQGIPTVPMDRAIRGMVNWNGPLAPLWRFVPLANASLTGMATIEASLSGTLAAPKGRLRVQVEQGAFEDVLSGIMLTDIQADMALNPFDAQLSVVSLSASDGKGGTVTLNGSIGSMADGLPLALQGVVTRLSPLHRNDLSILLSGTIALTGKALSPLIAADITVNKGQFEIVSSFGTSIPTLDVVDAATLVNVPAPASGTPGAPAQEGPQLQIVITIPNQFFVRGKGLESEWKGNLKVSGPATSPAITGQLTSVRGQFALLGKQFLLKTGEVSFSGANPPNPLLHVVVTYAGPNITAEATVGGTALAPALSLSSQPPLPQDEVMAQVLFGKSASELGRVEALQLAAELASLATFGGGGGLLNETRTALGLDVLRFGSVQKYQPQNPRRPTPFGSLGQSGQANQASEEQSIPSLEVGKYVFDNVYVGLEQGMNGDTGGVRVEIELAPHLNLEGRTTPEGSEIGVNWKKDY